jgi:hypothetical protein
VCAVVLVDLSGDQQFRHSVLLVAMYVLYDLLDNLSTNSGIAR